MKIASLFVTAAVGGPDVYLGPSFLILILVGAIAIAAGAVRYAAGKMTRR